MKKHIIELLKSINGYFGSKPKGFLLSWGILNISLVGFFDYLTGYRVGISLFYLLPIGFGTWFVGWKSGTLFSLLSFVSIAVADLLSGKVYENYMVEFWNMSMHLGFFIIITVLLDQLKREFLERTALIRELRDALNEVKTLSGLLPVCAWCKKIRDDDGYWDSIEDYIEKHSQAQFSHGICPECLEKCRRELKDGAGGR